MKPIISFSDDSERAEEEALKNGFRTDIHVEVDGEHYLLCAYDLNSFRAKVQNEMEANQCCGFATDAVVVSSVAKDTIVEVLNEMYQKGEFALLFPRKNEA